MLYKGDCLKVMPELIDQGVKVDLILCDLPYGTTACKWDTVIPFEPLWDCYKGLIKGNGAIVLFGSQPFTTDLINSNHSMFKYSMVWAKDKPSNFANANIMPMRYHEDICVFYSLLPNYNKQYEPRSGTGKNRVKYAVVNGFKEGDQNEHRIGCREQKKKYPELKQVGTILNVHCEVRKQGQHGTQKPVKLLETVIKMYTNEGDLVLDNCAGSGTTAIACMNTNRKYICIEQDDKYFQIMQDRIKNHVIQTELKI